MNRASHENRSTGRIRGFTAYPGRHPDPLWVPDGGVVGLVELKTQANGGRDVSHVEFAAHAAAVHVEQVRFRGSGLALGRVREEKEIRARIFEREVAAVFPTALIAAVTVRQVAHVSSVRSVSGSRRRTLWRSNGCP